MEQASDQEALVPDEGWTCEGFVELAPRKRAGARKGQGGQAL